MKVNIPLFARRLADRLHATLPGIYRRAAETGAIKRSKDAEHAEWIRLIEQQIVITLKAMARSGELSKKE